MFYPMSMGKHVGTLGNAKLLPSSEGLLATKLHGSYSHLPFASCITFFTAAHLRHSKWGEAPSHLLGNSENAQR